MLAKAERPDPRDIAARISKTAEHVDIIRRIDEIDAQLNSPERRARLLTYRSDVYSHQSELRVEAELDNRMAAERSKLKARRRQLDEERGARVAKELAPIRVQLAAELVDLLQHLDATWTVLEESTLAIERAGGSCVRLPKPDINRIIEQASRIAGKV